MPYRTCPARYAPTESRSGKTIMPWSPCPFIRYFEIVQSEWTGFGRVFVSLPGYCFRHLDDIQDMRLRAEFHHSKSARRSHE